MNISIKVGEHFYIMLIIFSEGNKRYSHLRCVLAFGRLKCWLSHTSVRSI
jgi:hypothetical protein